LQPAQPETSSASNSIVTSAVSSAGLMLPPLPRAVSVHAVACSEGCSPAGLPAGQPAMSMTPQTATRNALCIMAFTWLTASPCVSLCSCRWSSRRTARGDRACTGEQVALFWRNAQSPDHSCRSRSRCRAGASVPPGSVRILPGVSAHNHLLRFPVPSSASGLPPALHATTPKSCSAS